MTISIKQCILEFIRTLDRSHPIILFSHNIEGTLPQWTYDTYTLRHTPSSFARRWREIKSEASLHNLKITEVTQKGDRESSWKIEFLNTPQVVSQDVAVQVHSQN